MIKRITASGGGNLEAKAGESLLVKRIECVESSNDDYLSLYVDRVTVGFYRIKGKAGNHLSTIVTSTLKANLMEFLTNVGVNVSIPVAEGQVFNVSRYAETGNVLIVYDLYTAGDIHDTDINGSASKEYNFIQYGKVGTAPTASGDALVDTALTPAEFPDFPFGKVVPANYKINLLGIVGCPFVDAAGADDGFASTFLKLIKEREVLFDEDRNGIPFDGQDVAATALVYQSNFSLIGSSTPLIIETHLHVENTAGSYAQNANTAAASIIFKPFAPPLMFTPAIEFESGAELNVYLTVVKMASGTWNDNKDDQAFILNVVKQ